MDFNTKLLHGKTSGDYPYGATVPPISQVSAFRYESAEEQERVFNHKAAGFAYSRVGNPTVAAFEQRINELEGGSSATACSSGMSAITLALLNILCAGDEIIAGSGLYGGSIDLFEDLARFGIRTRYVRHVNVEEVEPLINEHTRLIYGEVIGNPGLDVMDVKAVADRPRGLVLVTGPTGSGKSTTLAAMIDYINRTRAEHILTIEDPVEFVHTSKKSIIHQRELGMDTRSFANALKSALREDPDIILVGEMRDHETIGLALTAAETGHLVFGTLHTSSASQTIDRIVDVFPEGQQQQIRVQLASSLIAVFSQTLLPKRGIDGKQDGRVMAQEILVVTPAVSNLIREGKAAQIYSTIQTSTEAGMQTLEASLADLVNKRLISIDDAKAKSQRVNELKRLIQGA